MFQRAKEHHATGYNWQTFYSPRMMGDINKISMGEYLTKEMIDASD
jgi:hypothetical protein